MLQTIRSYAAEQLDAEPDFADAVRRAHAEHYTELAVALREQLVRTDREQVLAALEVELGNLRAAWSHLVQQGDVVRLNDLLEPLWGYYDEIEHSISAALERSREHDDAAERFPVLRSLATLHLMRSDFDSALEIGRELLVIA